MECVKDVVERVGFLWKVGYKEKCALLRLGKEVGEMTSKNGYISCQPLCMNKNML